MPTAELGDGAEFDLIRALVARWGSLAQGIGDDAALIDIPAGHRAVASVDSAVEGVHFRREWLTAREIGYRATAAALSDLAAMAATPNSILVALSLPAEWNADIGEVADGIGDMARLAHVVIAGGNVTRAPVFSITTTVLGTGRNFLLRSGVRPGDLIYVTGELGGPAAALRALEGGEAPDERHRSRFARPVPRIGEALWLARRGATAAIDISDGLVADLGHLAAASGLRLSIDLAALRLVPETSAVDAASSGEEYELVVASPVALDVSAFEAEFGIPLTAIGSAVPGKPGVETRLGGKLVAPPGGHDHLSR